MRDEELMNCLRSDVLHLILMPTEACNLRCVYCYEDFQLGRMRPDVVAGVKRLLERRSPGLRRLILSWFGGEPLLARNVIEDIQQHAVTLAAGQPQLRLSSDITTNAYTLTPQVFGRLLNLGITKYQISFDGPRAWHDRLRVRPNGEPTFDRIWSHLCSMRDVPGSFSVVVRVHVSPENRPHVPDFVDAYRTRFGDDPRFRIFLRSLSRWGGPNDATLVTFAEEDARRELAVLRERLAADGLGVHDPNSGTSVCYAAHGNSWVVRADGRLSKCTLALDHPKNQVGRILPDGRVEIDAGSMQGWMRGLISEDEGELHCPMRGLADSTMP